MSSETRQFPSLHSAIHSVRYPLKSIFFVAICQLLGTTESACFLLHIYWDGLSLPIKSRKLPTHLQKTPLTADWLKLDHVSIPEPISVDRKILCADWIRPRFLINHWQGGWCYWVMLISAKPRGWVPQPSLRYLDTWEVICLQRNKRKMNAKRPSRPPLHLITSSLF